MRKINFGNNFKNPFQNFLKTTWSPLSFFLLLWPLLGLPSSPPALLHAVSTIYSHCQKTSNITLTASFQFFDFIEKLSFYILQLALRIIPSSSSVALSMKFSPSPELPPSATMPSVALIFLLIWSWASRSRRLLPMSMMFHAHLDKAHGKQNCLNIWLLHNFVSLFAVINTSNYFQWIRSVRF